MNTNHSKRIQRMFDRIAKRYDTFNTVASFGRDEAWRRLAVQLAAPAVVERALDAASGTGKLSATLASKAAHVTALDFSNAMLLRSKRLFEIQGLTEKVSPLQGDVLALPFGENTFDCATIGFGLRNLDNILAGLIEFHRVLKPEGRLVVLDIVMPTNMVSKAIFTIGFRFMLPLIGWALSGNRAAYQYLPNSVQRYLTPTALAAKMKEAGFSEVSYRQLFLGSIAIHWGRVDHLPGSD
ncbi:MAG: ubiquinone/menaquinone biosynthesis methyltransferase [Chloroflexota bacterium]|nr:ubiquinone/menaquinone biosynthesis methyltransferase [Chloroflexota bacterium]